VVGRMIWKIMLLGYCVDIPTRNHKDSDAHLTGAGSHAPQN
jgi:hypothetical protein